MLAIQFEQSNRRTIRMRAANDKFFCPVDNERWIAMQPAEDHHCEQAGRRRGTRGADSSVGESCASHFPPPGPRGKQAGARPCAACRQGPPSAGAPWPSRPSGWPGGQRRHWPAGRAPALFLGPDGKGGGNPSGRHAGALRVAATARSGPQAAGVLRGGSLPTTRVCSREQWAARPARPRASAAAGRGVSGRLARPLRMHSRAAWQGQASERPANLLGPQ